jgi:hypothetical protein
MPPVTGKTYHAVANSARAPGDRRESIGAAKRVQARDIDPRRGAFFVSPPRLPLYLLTGRTMTAAIGEE